MRLLQPHLQLLRCEEHAAWCLTQANNLRRDAGADQRRRRLRSDRETDERRSPPRQPSTFCSRRGGAPLTAPKRGPVERATRRDVRGLGELAGIQHALAEAAFNLAKSLDAGAGLATAAVARELRATLLTLKEAGGVGAGADDLAAALSSPMDDPAIPRAANAGAAGGAGGGGVGDAADAVAAARRRRRAGGPSV